MAEPKLKPCSGDGNGWTDDPAIAPEDRLIRYVKTGWHIAKKQSGEYIVSHKAFLAMGPGVSVELFRLYAEKRTDCAARLLVHDAVGAQRLAAKHVREVSRTYDKDGNGSKEKLGICHTPNQPDGPNPFHCDIFPEPSEGAAKRLRTASETEIALDQPEAARRYQLVRAKPT